MGICLLSNAAQENWENSLLLPSVSKETLCWCCHEHKASEPTHGRPFPPDNLLKYCNSRHFKPVCAAAAPQHSALIPAHYSCYFQCSLYIPLARKSREISLHTGSNTSVSQLQILPFPHPVSHALPKPTCTQRE